jgi:cytidylate kinase
MIRIITISRQFGSGGGKIAEQLAERLGWRLVDQSVVHEIAARARVAPEIAAQYDERVDPWFHRMVKALWQGGYEGAASTIEAVPVDSESVAALSSAIVQEAAALGDAVIVGRGAQCLLARREDAFHVSVHAPRKLRLARLRERLPAAANLEAMLEERDRQRAAYVQRYFNRDWTDRRLYHLVVCTSIGIDRAVDTILCAAGLKGRVRA